VIDADSLISAKERLRRDKVLVTEVHALPEKHEERRLAPPLLLSFTREVAQLLRAGLPLYEGLLTIEEKYRRHKDHPLFLDLCDHLKEGANLSSALKRYPASFNPIYLAMVQVAEESGDLAAVFEELSQLITRQQKLRKQLGDALTYPTFLLIFCFCVVMGLLFFVIPSMKELFEGRALHPVTSLVLGVSAWVNAYGTTLLVTLLSCIGGAIWALRRPFVRLSLYKRALTLPLVRSLLVHAALLRFARAMGMLLSGGVPLLEALDLAKGVVKSPPFEEAIREARERIAQGERLSGAFSHDPLIPTLMLRMLSLSEETGKMQSAFYNLAGIYDEEMEKHLSQLTTFLQPALLIALGAIVGLVVLSILLPLTDVSSFASN
jgi:general secretion pathway protein F/type IV pilus assembly protein PilC